MVYKDYSPSQKRRRGDTGKKAYHRPSATAMKAYLTSLVMGGVPVGGGGIANPTAVSPQMRQQGLNAKTPALHGGLSAISFKEAERNAEAASQQDGGVGANTGPDPIDQLVAQLYKSVPEGAVSGQLDPKFIKQQLSQAGAAGAPYSAQINSLMGQNAGARRDTAKGRKAVQAMYRALAGSDAKSANDAVATQQELAAQINREAATGNQQNQTRAQQLMATNAQYGPAGASLNTDVAKQAVTAQAANTQQAATFAAAALQQGGNNSNYFRQNSSADRLEGSNRASDLVSQLQGYLQGNRNKMAELAGQRSAAVASARSSILSQIQSASDKFTGQANKAAQTKWEDMLKLLQFQSGRQNTTEDNARADASLQALIQSRMASGQAAQNRSDASGQLSPDELAKILGSSGTFKNMSMDQIIKALQQVYGQ